jgi:hypothetical protein
MEVNVESPLFTVNHDLEENVEEDVSVPTIPLMNVIEECFYANAEAPTSSFVYGATTKKREYSGYIVV